MSKSEKVTPARLIVKRFGVSARQLSAELDLSAGHINCWISRGGNIPNREQLYEKILQHAKKKRVRLTLAELVYGGVP